MEIPVNVPDGKCGGFEVLTYTITDESAMRYNLSLMMNGHGARAVKPGVYKKLIWRDPKNHNNGTQKILQVYCDILLDDKFHSELLCHYQGVLVEEQATTSISGRRSVLSSNF